VKISLDWLGDLVSWDDTPEDLAVKLTAAGLNVESIEQYAQTFPGVVIAKVVHREKHPDADRLSLCRVDAGLDEPIQVVCGAPNVREGLTVLFATVGSVLPGDFKIKKSKIRGVESFGMICSANELQLTGDFEGIMELDTDLVPGTPADELYGFQDTVLDIEVTPNRPDWLSHFGVAREVAAIYGTKASLPRTWGSQQTGENLGIKVRIDDYADCPRYTAFGARDVTVGPSPKWMQDRLRSVGSRPINNVVDITNYVLFELGQPMHAFDQSKLSGNTITVNRAAPDTTVVTLDDQERKLEAGTLLVCDEKGPVALAGVMGLANSEVEISTRDILLESAFFNPQLVRSASRGLGLISESSYRFERGADWDMVVKAAHRALFLFQELAGAHIVTDWADRHDPDRKPAESVPLRIWQVNRMLGTQITTDEAAQALQNLGLKVQPMGNPGSSNSSAVNMMIEVPSFRRDLHQEVDLIEEIARSYGFDRMSGNGGFLGTTGAVRRPLDLARNRIRSWFAGCGYNEMVTSTFYAAGDLEKLGLSEGDVRLQTLSVINPHHGGNTQLRTSLVPSLLDVARRNINSGSDLPLRLFQINKTFLPGGTLAANPRHEDEKLLPEEPLLLQFSVAGSKARGLDGVPADLLEIKGVVEALSTYLRIPLTLEVVDCEVFLTPDTQFRILDGEGKLVGNAGQISSKVLEAFDVDLPVTVAEIDLTELDLTPQALTYQDFSRYPAVKRDLSLLVPQGVTYGEIRAVVVESGGALLETVDLFDIYRGKGLPEGAGAYGIRLKFRSAKGNLKGKTVDGAIKVILEALSSRLKIEQRG
jgi:phenylalanyl-tRNA synthetase beta chain